MLCLRLLGGCNLARDGDSLSGPAVQHRRLALLALLAGHKASGLSRDKLTAYFWPEEDRERARHFLADSLFTIRRSIGKESLVTVGSDVRLNPEVIRTDLWLFEDARAREDCESAANVYAGPFLDGFFISDAPEFERWVTIERDRLEKQYAGCLERLANQHENSGNFPVAATWWDRLAVHDPYSARITLRTMDALSKSGDCAAALRHAAKYEKLMRDDLDLPPDNGVLAFANRLRAPHGQSAELNEPIFQSTSRTGASKAVSHVSHPTAISPPPPEIDVQTKPRAATTRYLRVAALVIVAGAGIELGARSLRNAEAVSTDQRPFPNAAVAHDHVQVRSAREDAEELYHRGRLALKLPDGQGHDADAIVLFRSAIDRDPTFAPSYAGLADALDANGDGIHAKQAALKALSLDSGLAEGHASLAYVLAFYEHHWQAADTALARAIQLSPQFALAHMRHAYVYAAMGRAEDAVACAEHARRIEPESWTVLYNRGLIEFAVNRPKEAIPLYEAALALEPEHTEVKLHLAWAYKATGQNEAALAVVRTMGSNPDATTFGGDDAAMKALLARFEKDSVKLEPSHAGIMYAWLGNRDRAFTQLRRSISSDRFLPLHMRQMPVVRLRNDPRYAKLMADLGLDPGDSR